jgi:hypothetical protein
VGTTAWHYDKGSWSETTLTWKSNDDWGWREELRANGYDPDPAIRLGDLDSDSLAAEAYTQKDGKGYAVVLTIGEGGEVITVDGLPGLVGLLNEVGPSISRVSELSGGATNVMEREYARLRKLGYPHDVADEASRTFADELAAADEGES